MPPILLHLADALPVLPLAAEVTPLPVQLHLLGMATAVCAALCVGSILWLVGQRLARMQVERREFKVRLPLMFRILLPLAGTFRGWVRHPSLSRTVTDTDSKLVQAGLDQNMRPEDFVGLRILYLIVFVGIGLIFLVLGGILALRPYIFFGVFLMLYGALHPTIWLRSTIKARHRSIQRALPNVLDLLTLSVEAGRDFLTGLREILKNRQKDPLGDELERVFRETQLGKPRRQALRDMADRVKQADLTSVVETLSQADELGVSIGHILRILGEQMRQKRFQHAEKLANESPVKLMLPLFLFIFPAVLLVIFGPILLRWQLGDFL